MAHLHLSSMGKGRTALLYFAYRPDAEAIRKPILSGHGHKVNVRFYQELQDELFSQVTPLGLPLIHIDDQSQHGNGFAEKLCNAVEEVWKQGFEKVIVLGNDLPELETSSYQRALEFLEDDKACLVRTQNGGAGLIALDRKKYKREHWLEIEWQSNNAFNDLFDCLPSCKVLDIEAIELNSLADLYAYLEMHRGKDSIAFLIESILNPLRNFVSLQSKEKEASFYTTRKLRGPPFSC